MQLTTNPIPGLTLSARGSYTDAVINKYVGVNADVTEADFAGIRIPYPPKFSGSLNADYTWTLANRFRPFVGATATGQSTEKTIVGGDSAVVNGSRPFQVNSYALLNLRADFTSLNSRWNFMVYGGNVTDRY